MCTIHTIEEKNRFSERDPMSMGFYLCCAYTVTTHWLNDFRLVQYCDWRMMYHLAQEQVGDMEDHAERELGGKQC